MTEAYPSDSREPFMPTIELAPDALVKVAGGKVMTWAECLAAMSAITGREGRECDGCDTSGRCTYVGSACAPEQTPEPVAWRPDRAVLIQLANDWFGPCQFPFEGQTLSHQGKCAALADAILALTAPSTKGGA